MKADHSEPTCPKCGWLVPIDGHDPTCPNGYTGTLDSTPRHLYIVPMTTTAQTRTSFFRVTIAAQGMGTETFDLPAGNCFTADDAERVANDRAAWVRAEHGVEARARVRFEVAA